MPTDILLVDLVALVLVILIVWYFRILDRR